MSNQLRDPTRTPDGRWYGEPTLRPDQIVPFLRSVTASGETLHEADFARISAALRVTDTLGPCANRAEHERQSSTGTHSFDPHCPFCFFDRFDAETRAALADQEATR